MQPEGTCHEPSSLPARPRPGARSARRGRVPLSWQCRPRVQGDTPMSLPSWFGCLHPRSPRRRVGRRLYVEPLEDRCLLTGGLSAALVADVIPGPLSSLPANLTNVNGTLYFATARYGPDPV